MPDELPPTAPSVTLSDSVSSAAGDNSTEETASAETSPVEKPSEGPVPEEPTANATEVEVESNEVPREEPTEVSVSSETESAEELVEASALVEEPEGVTATSAAEDEDAADAPVEVSETEGTDSPAEEAKPDNKQWYVVKVQSNREDSIRAAIERKVRIEGLEEFFGQIVIPVERIQELRRGKRVTKAIKLYPGYLFAQVEFNDRILYLFREVSGVGDFVGGGPLGKAPTPMRPEEVERMINRQPTSEKPGEEGAAEKPREVIRTRPRFSVGDRLRVCDGNFSGMEGEVIDITEDRVKLQVLVLGMPVTLDLEFWQVEPL